MAIGKFRNKVCYCGSGKKFKHCHILILEKAKADNDQKTYENESPQAYLIDKHKIKIALDK